VLVFGGCLVLAALLLTGDDSTAFGQKKPAPGKPAPGKPAAKAPQPIHFQHLQHALQHLEQARMHLKEAHHTFGGHRLAAEKDTNSAIRQVHQALAFKSKK
jgi:hypothetical protein